MLVFGVSHLAPQNKPLQGFPLPTIIRIQPVPELVWQKCNAGRKQTVAFTWEVFAVWFLRLNIFSALAELNEESAHVNKSLSTLFNVFFSVYIFTYWTLLWDFSHFNAKLTRETLQSKKCISAHFVRFSFILCRNQDLNPPICHCFLPKTYYSVDKTDNFMTNSDGKFRNSTMEWRRREDSCLSHKGLFIYSALYVIFVII